MIADQNFYDMFYVFSILRLRPPVEGQSLSGLNIQVIMSRAFQDNMNYILEEKKSGVISISTEPDVFRILTEKGEV